MRAVIGIMTLAVSVVLTPAMATAQRKDEPIIVTGNRNIEKQISQFVKAMTPGSQTSNIAQFEADVCPAAIGFMPRQKILIERRLRRVAVAAGWRVQREGCAPNAVFFAAADKAKFIRSLRKSHPSLFGEMSPSEIRRLIEEPGPTAAWQVDELLTAGGARYAEPSGGNSPPLKPDLLSYSQKNNARASRISTGTRRAVAASLLLVEESAFEGLTTTQIADYAAMRLFARTDPNSVPPGISSILTIVDAPAEREVPVTLTEWDLSFLRALHASPKSLFSAAQRGEIAHRMARELSSDRSAPQ